MQCERAGARGKKKQTKTGRGLEGWGSFVFEIANGIVQRTVDE
jgi:hypothetical protein